MNHIDFQIRAWKADKSHAQVMVHSSPVGDMSKPVTVPFRETQQRDFFTACESLFNIGDISPSSNDSKLQKAIQMGRQLSQIILPPPVLTLLLSSPEHISSETGLRLRLCLDNSLIDLPWEFLYRPDMHAEEKPDHKSLNGFLALNPRISFVRLSPTTSLKLQPSTEKQRIVFASMTHGGEFLTLGAEDEYKELSKALEPLEKFIKLEFITASLDNFRKVLAKPVSRVIGKASTATPVLDKTALRKALVVAFTEEELKILCADVQQNIQDDGIELLVNLEVAGGETKEATILELIGYLDRRGVLDYLVSAALKERSKLSETIFLSRGLRGS